MTVSVDLPRSRYETGDAQRAFVDEALRRIRALPGVIAAGATDTIPLGANHSNSVILAEGYQMQPGESLISPNAVDVTPGYFEAMGVTRLAGRFFDARDRVGARRVIHRRRDACEALLARPEPDWATCVPTEPCE